MPASTTTGRPAGSQPSTVTPWMLTSSGCDGVPSTAMMSPTPLRMSGWLSMMRPPTGTLDTGVIFTRSAPAPLSVRSFVIVSAFVPG